jgi:hypothetical protein
LHLKSNLSKISLGELTNKVVLDFRSVSLKASNINDLDLKAVNSTLQFDGIQNANIQTKHCEVGAKVIASVIIEKSSFSEFSFREADYVDIVDSKSDTFTILELKSLSCSKSIFTNYKIHRLKERLNITSENGDITIDDLDDSFSRVTINNSFSIIKIGSANASNLLVDTRTQLSKYFFGSDLKKLDENNIDDPHYFSKSNKKRCVKVKNQYYKKLSFSYKYSILMCENNLKIMKNKHVTRICDYFIKSLLKVQVT